MTTRSGVENTILYDPAQIAERFDLVPAQMIDYKALKGDPTDNIPGVPGVGEKTAAKLIREFGTLEALYERIDEVKPDKLRDKLVEHRDAVFMGKDLSTIVRDLPVDFDLEAARLGDYDRETVIRLFREYEFRSLIERLPRDDRRDRGRRRRGAARRRHGGSVPAARVAGPPGRRAGARPARAAAVGGRRAPALARLRRGRPRGTRRRRRPRPRRPPSADRRRPSSPATCRPRWPRRSPTRHASRSMPATASPPWSRGSPRRPPSGSACSSTTRGPGADRRSRSPSPATDGRTIAVEGPDDAATLRRLLDRLATPVVGHEIKPLARAADRRRPGRRRDTRGVRHADRRLRPQRRAAQPDHRRRGRRAARPDPAPGRRARQRAARPVWRPCRRSPSASRSSDASWRMGSTGCTASWSCR